MVNYKPKQSLDGCFIKYPSQALNNICFAPKDFFDPDIISIPNPRNQLFF